MLRSPAHIVGHGPTSGGIMGMHTHPSPPAHARSSLFDSCHRKIRLIGGGPVAFLGGLVAKARRKEKDGDQNANDTKLYLEESVLERKLTDANLNIIVELPAGLDYNEWLASHTLALFEHVNLVYGTISEFCTTSGCPDMTGPGNRMYLWFDEKGKKTRVAAPQYIDYVMTFTQKTVSDESIFPTKYANEFPSSFESIARKILRLLFHVIAHLYAAHFREIALLGLHSHLNLTFAHLTALHKRFNLIESKETDVLRDLEIALRLTDDPAFPQQQQQQQQTPSLSSSESNSQTTLLQSSITTITVSSSLSATAVTSATSNTKNILASATTILSSGTTSSTLNYSDDQTVSLIDGDANIQPICTQPELGGIGQRSTATANVITGGMSSSPTTTINSSGMGNDAANGGNESQRGLALGVNNCTTTTSQQSTATSSSSSSSTAATAAASAAATATASGAMTTHSAA